MTWSLFDWLLFFVATPACFALGCWGGRQGMRWLIATTPSSWDRNPVGYAERMLQGRIVVSMQLFGMMGGGWLIALLLRLVGWWP